VGIFFRKLAATNKNVKNVSFHQHLIVLLFVRIWSDLKFLFSSSIFNANLETRTIPLPVAIRSGV